MQGYPFYAKHPFRLHVGMNDTQCFKGFGVCPCCGDSYGPVSRHPYGRLQEGQVLTTEDPLRPGYSGIHFLVKGIRSACEKGDVWEIAPIGEVAEQHGNYCARQIRLVRRIGFCEDFIAFAKEHGLCGDDYFAWDKDQ